MLETQQKEDKRLPTQQIRSNRSRTAEQSCRKAREYLNKEVKVVRFNEFENFITTPLRKGAQQRDAFPARKRKVGRRGA
jgi:hypothetical protein